MRVLLLTHNAPGGGGTFSRARALARALAGRGHQVTLLASASRRRLASHSTDAGGALLVEAPGWLGARVCNGGLCPVDVASRVRLAATARPQLVHAFGHRPAVLLPALAMARRGVPWVMDWADLWGPGGLAEERGATARLLLGGADGYAERWACRRAAAVTVVSAELERRAASLRGGTCGLLRLPAGADVEAIRPRDRDAARRACGLDPAARIALYLGPSRLDDELLGRTLVELARSDASACLLAVGAALPETRRLAARHGLAGRLLERGPVAPERLGELLACADVLLLPAGDRGANRARFPSKLGDYLAAGRAIAANPIGDASRLLEQEGAGVVVEAAPQAYATAIAALLADPRRSSALGAAARHVAERQLAWGLLAADLESLYRDVAARAGRPRAGGAAA